MPFFHCECGLRGKVFKSSLEIDADDFIQSLNDMEYKITITVNQQGDDVTVKADFPDGLNVVAALLAIDGSIEFIKGKVDAKARANGFGSASEAPGEFTQPLTFNEILNQW